VCVVFEKRNSGVWDCIFLGTDSENTPSSENLFCCFSTKVFCHQMQHDRRTLTTKQYKLNSLTHGLRAPGFNPRSYEVKTRFQSLLFQTPQLAPLCAGESGPVLERAGGGAAERGADHHGAGEGGLGWVGCFISLPTPGCQCISV
jgi:hypothetical protein